MGYDRRRWTDVGGEAHPPGQDIPAGGGIGQLERRSQGHHRAIAIRYQTDLVRPRPNPTQPANDAEGRPVPLARDAARDEVSRALFRGHPCRARVCDAPRAQ